MLLWYVTVVGPDFELRRGPGFYFTRPAGFSSFSHFFFFPKNKHLCAGLNVVTNFANPHKSKLCGFHDINLCIQHDTIKTSYQEYQNNSKNIK